MIKRDYYLNKLIDYKDKEIVKIITGIRRSGKSFLLFNIYNDYLISIGVDEFHIIKINLESFKFEKLRNPIELYSYLEEKITDSKKYYIFIDEIQLLEKFEDVVNGIIIDFNCDLYITGSNSKLLSSEINTKLRGRGIEIKIFPLSFKEFYNAEKSIDASFNEFVKYGGLPYITQLDKDYEKNEYLQMINNTVSFKDIIEKNNIRNEAVFNAVVDLLCSQIGCYVSPHKIANTLMSNGFKTVDDETISNYLAYLCDAFLFYKAVRFDLKGKGYLKTNNKYYVCDLGLRNQKLGYRQMEMTHIIENVVFLELLRRNYQVDIGKNNDSEIDFVARSSNDLYYIQVSLSIEKQETKERECASFKGLSDGYKKIIITMDKNPLSNLENGYKMLNLYDFLLNENSLKNV